MTLHAHPIFHSLLFPLPKYKMYKVSGIYKPQICRKLAARLRLIVAARLPQMRFSYANYFSGALFWHTMCATSMQRTVVAHIVCRKFAAHNCRVLFWYTMCAASLQRTIVAHCSGTQCAAQVCGAQLSCTILCATSLRHTVAVHSVVPPPPHPSKPPPPSPNPQFITPPPYIFLVPSPQGECEKKWGVGVLQKIKICGWGWEKM